MPVNIQKIEVQPAGVQQFQADRSFERDRCTPSMQIVTNQDQPLLDADDISLAMRQFFQSPIRSAG